MKSWVDQHIKSKTRIAIPIMTHPGIEMIGKTVKNAVQHGDIHAQAIKKLADIFPTVASTVIMDLTLEAEAFGCAIEFQENEMPHILGRLLNNIHDIENLKVPDLNVGRVQEYLIANRLTIENFNDRPVFAGVIGPFSLAGRLFDMSELMMACYTEPETIMILLDKCTKFIINYCAELKNIGCSGVVVAEPAAGLLSNDDCQIFSSVYVKKLVDKLQDDNFMVILHNCGNTGHCTDAMLFTGANAYHFGNAIDIVETLRKCPNNKLILGNVDPVGIMKMKTPEEIKIFIGDLLLRTTEFDNFVLSTGCDLPPHVPLTNVEAFFEALALYNLTNEKENHCAI